MKDMKAMARPFLALYAMALVIALLGRIGLAVAGGTGVLAFDYISASGVPVLDVICSILTGSAFVAFLFAAGLALCVSTAGAVLYGALASRDGARAATCAEGADADAPAGATGASAGVSVSALSSAALYMAISDSSLAVLLAPFAAKVPEKVTPPRSPRQPPRQARRSASRGAGCSLFSSPAFPPGQRSRGRAPSRSP